ncbi:MAG TPA: response regulator [Candidatus Acidoferrales bacterium]|nr:response regulator [Candidatus Acidoferrales bacterium]
MSDTLETASEKPTGKVPTVYFIDDSATMREVIKIAFRRESINVITCHDAASALVQFGETVPDAVITDVIMPGKDGYEVCQLIKKDEHLAKTPVILMSGVVDKTVAEKAIAVRADELIRKPFQPQDLIARVKNLLDPKPHQQTPAVRERPITSAEPRLGAASLSGIFAMPAESAPPAAMRPMPPALSERPAVPVASYSAPRPAAPTAEIQKLKFEIQRLEMLVKKLLSELEAERSYVASLESHMRTLQETE